MECLLPYHVCGTCTWLWVQSLQSLPVYSLDFYIFFQAVRVCMCGTYYDLVHLVMSLINAIPYVTILTNLRIVSSFLSPSLSIFLSVSLHLPLPSTSSLSSPFSLFLSPLPHPSCSLPPPTYPLSPFHVPYKTLLIDSCFYFIFYASCISFSRYMQMYVCT